LASTGEVDFFGRAWVDGDVRAVAWSNLDVATSPVESFAAGDRAFWDLEGYTPTQIIDKLKDGTLRHHIHAVENNGVDNSIDARVEDVTLVVTYTEPAAGGSPGRRGAVLIGF
jgi:hypothetical protein